MASQSINTFWTEQTDTEDKPLCQGCPATVSRARGPAAAPMLQEMEQPPVHLPAQASRGGEVERGTGTRGDAWESFPIADEDEEKPLRQTPQSKYRW